MRPTTRRQYLIECVICDAPFYLVVTAWLLAIAVLLVFTFETVGQTNVVPVTIVAVPAAERVETWLTVINNWLTGALAIVSALALAWGKLRSNKATESSTIASVLIQEIQKIASKKLKDDIAGAARDAGVGDALHQKVKDETPSAPVSLPALVLAVKEPFNPPYLNPAVDAAIRNLPPVANFPPVDEIKPI